ncbi:aminodeoxychorismate synthase component I, partial [Rhodococcus hoagii]|nr:aminodeoxychorismate synthase component I [Prescottella equi]
RSVSGESYEVCLTNAATVDRVIDTAELRDAPGDQSHPVQCAAAVLGSIGAECLTGAIPADRRGPVVDSKPIKGTRPRHASPEQDAALRQDLLDSEKDRAEKPDDRRSGAQRPVAGVRPRFGTRPQAVRRRDVRSRPSTGVDGAWHAPGRRVVRRMRAGGVPGRVDDGCAEAEDDGDHRQARGGASRRVLGAIGYFSINGTADFSIVIRTMVATAIG